MRIRKTQRHISTRSANPTRVGNGNIFDKGSVKDPWTDATSLFLETGRDNQSMEGYNSTFLKPYLFHMMCCGLYFDEDVTAKGQNPPRNLWKIYSLIVVLLNFVNFFMFLVPTLVMLMDMGFGDIATMSCMITWTLQNCITSSTCFYICSSGRFQRDFLRKWHPLYAWGSAHEVSVPKTLLNRVRATLYAVVVVNILNVAGWIFLCFDFISSGIGLRFFPLVSVLDKITVCYLVKVWGLLSIIGTPAWTMPTGLFVLTALSLITLFSSFNEKFCSAVRNAEPTSGFNVEAFRLQNERLIAMVEVADRLFGVFLFSSFVTTLLLASLIVYRTIFYCSIGWLKAIEIFWFLAEFGILLGISYVCAEVNTAAHKSLGELYSLSTQYASSKYVLQISLFIDRLTTMTVGFSGWGFFFINRGFILTLVSGFFTYFFLLLQFGGEAPSRAMCLMNGTVGGNK